MDESNTLIFISFMGLLLIALHIAVFHVRDQDGNKLTDESLVHHIQQVSLLSLP